MTEQRLNLGEHHLTQQIRIMCPEGRHRIGMITAEAGDALMFGLDTVGFRVRSRFARGSDAELLSEDRDAGLIRAWCPGCVKAGLRRATVPAQLKVADFLAIIAAQCFYGPASVTVPASKAGLRAELQRIIPDGDHARLQRRELFEALMRSRPRVPSISSGNIG